MQTSFYKYQGAGNDFILIDARDPLPVDWTPKTISYLCDRRFGIGADGLMLLQNKNGYDFEMRYFNADGKEGSMCGNGGRCIVAFAKALGIIDKETNFLAVDGPHYAKISADSAWVELQMIDVKDIQKDGAAYILNTGSPHFVKEVFQLQEKDVFKDGAAIRNSETYKAEGINVNFVENMGDHWFVRTFERGVEDETYACGTGATAVALAMAKHLHQNGDIVTPIRVLGGQLEIRFRFDGEQFTNVFLCGPAQAVYKGEINI
ncbi:MAG: diaminopimelate epimerase [Pedobacter sp.]|nr:MAG: diaminopimelate epimerase [Pedobacter sp.]